MDRRALIRFAAGAIVGTFIGAAILILLGELKTGEPYLKCRRRDLRFGCVVCTRAKGPAAAARESTRDFVGVGVLAGAAGPTIGAVGPLIAPIFARHDYIKERLIATKAACQMFLSPVEDRRFYCAGHVRRDAARPAAIGHDRHGHSRHTGRQTPAQVRFAQRIQNPIPGQPCSSPAAKS